MKKEEKLIKEYLKEKFPDNRSRKTPDCPDDNTLLDYLKNNLNYAKKQEIEKHIAGCSHCLGQISIAHEALEKFRKKNFAPIPKSIRTCLDIDKRNARMPKKTRKKIFFLTAAIIFFVLSFLIPKYFAQFLVGALILGIRWSFESESGKTLIMVLDSWRKHSHDKNGEISNRLKDHFKK